MCQGKSGYKKGLSTLLEILVSDGDVFSRTYDTYILSTLLEILGWERLVRHISRLLWLFQPFLRFWLTVGTCCMHPPHVWPLSTLLEILAMGSKLSSEEMESILFFQPFLRFWGLCGWFLWVFKFFFGFLSSRRSV